MPDLITLLGGVLIVLLIAAVAFFVFRRRPKAPPPPPDLRIDVRSRPLEYVPDSPRLSIQGVPVRLAVVVLASAGRAQQIPPSERWAELFQSVVPGLADVVNTHAPQIITWPPQLSAVGFNQVFFRNLLLPGDRGRGTPWCALAGPARASDGRVFLIGLVMQAGEAVYLSCQTVQHETEWRKFLEVKLRP